MVGEGGACKVGGGGLVCGPPMQKNTRKELSHIYNERLALCRRPQAQHSTLPAATAGLGAHRGPRGRGNSVTARGALIIRIMLNVWRSAGAVVLIKLIPLILIHIRIIRMIRTTPNSYFESS